MITKKSLLSWIFPKTCDSCKFRVYENRLKDDPSFLIIGGGFCSNKLNQNGNVADADFGFGFGCSLLKTTS